MPQNPIDAENSPLQWGNSLKDAQVSIQRNINLIISSTVIEACGGLLSYKHIFFLSTVLLSCEQQ